MSDLNCAHCGRMIAVTETAIQDRDYPGDLYHWGDCERAAGVWRTRRVTFAVTVVAADDCDDLLGEVSDAA